MMNTNSPELPRWLTWGVPYGFALFTLALVAFWPDSIRHGFGGELGLLENLEATVLAATLWVAILALRTREICQGRGLLLWVGLFSLGIIYILGEEISWGQHYFGWGTPEWYQAVNDQQETNLHNTSSWLDQKPRALIEFAVYFTMLIYPWLKRFWQPGLLTRLPAWMWPTGVCLPAALLMLIAQILDFSPLGKAGQSIGLRLSEMREFALFFFFYCYIYSLYRRRASFADQTQP